MSWHYRFVAENKKAIGPALDKHMAVVDSDFLCELTTKMHQVVRTLNDHEGIAWLVESFGHVGFDGANFTFKVEPIDTTANRFYGGASDGAAKGARE
jgi:hypothetical protein